MAGRTLTINELYVLRYLRDGVKPTRWVRPTLVGKVVQGGSSSWASPILLRLTAAELVQRQDPGMYRITQAGREAIAILLPPNRK